MHVTCAYPLCNVNLLNKKKLSITLTCLTCLLFNKPTLAVTIIAKDVHKLILGIKFIKNTAKSNQTWLNVYVCILKNLVR